MLAKQFHLKGFRDYERVKNEGKLFQFPDFGLSVLDRKDNVNSRFGFIVSTKISKESVQRNRIRRALSEAVRFLMSEIKNGHDVVFLTKQVSLKRSTDELMKEVRIALKEAELIK